MLNRPIRVNVPQALDEIVVQTGTERDRFAIQVREIAYHLVDGRVLVPVKFKVTMRYETSRQSGKRWWQRSTPATRTSKPAFAIEDIPVVCSCISRNLFADPSDIDLTELRVFSAFECEQIACACANEGLIMEVRYLVLLFEDVEQAVRDLLHEIALRIKTEQEGMHHLKRPTA